MRGKTISFSYNHSNPFNGVINYLRTYEVSKFNNFLTVESSPFYSGGQPRYSIDNTSNYWIGIEGDRTFIRYTMPYPIRSEGYVIMTSNYSENNCHPRTWILEASLDGLRNNISKEYSDDGTLNNKNGYK